MIKGYLRIGVDCVNLTKVPKEEYWIFSLQITHDIIVMLNPKKKSARFIE